MGDFPIDLVVSTVAHRPWAIPNPPWIMTQSWHDLLFAHWPVPADTLRGLVPAQLELDRFDNQTWLGVVPFRLTNVAPRLSPNIPFVSAFDEVNVRTYVTKHGKPGIYFFSLDANSRLAVTVARRIFRLPYYRADIGVREDASEIRYSSRRIAGRAKADLEIRYRAAGPIFEAVRGTLEYFLTERYCLYTTDGDRRGYRLEITHPPWRLQAANGEIAVTTVADAAGIRLPAARPLLHFAKRQDMIAWPLMPI